MLACYVRWSDCIPALAARSHCMPVPCMPGGCRRTCTMHADISAQTACRCTTVCPLPYHQRSSRACDWPPCPSPTRQTLQQHENAACHRCIPTHLTVHATAHVPPIAPVPYSACNAECHCIAYSLACHNTACNAECHCVITCMPQLGMQYRVPLHIQLHAIAPVAY